MKRMIYIAVFSTLFFFPTIPCHAEQTYYQPAEKSKEELMMDLFLSLLSPHIDQTVFNYYSDFLLKSPMVYPYQIDITSMNRIGEYRSFEFLVTLEVTPVVGPHISVGKDQLIFYISPGIVKLKKFKHLETYELPPRWQHIIKKKISMSPLS
ncbi:DUF3888 domain-containing protein [Bacillus sp. FJAT-52991]|uniref:DUF3888 domain-containing protein n=1 Tax=Bacillus kandeliae TaxID=3129297 RepID=A0ABZ2NB66_9BACI